MAARRPLVDVGGRVKQLPAGDRLDLPLATTTDPGLMPAADKAKLNGVQNGATANSPDATLLNRANHTGTQTLATISDAGTAAARNVQGSPGDVTPNVVLLSGAYGWGTLVAALETDLDVIRPNQLIRVAAGNAANPNGGIGTNVLTFAEGANFGSQLAMAAGGSPGTYPLKQRIRASTTAWGPWTAYWNELNQLSIGTSPLSARTALEINQGVVIPSNSLDFNAGPYIVTGQYTLPASADSGFANPPPTASGLSRAYLRTYSTGGYITQELSLNNGRKFDRSFNGSSWTAWGESWGARSLAIQDYSTTAQMQAAIVAATTGTNILNTSGTSITVVTQNFTAGAQYLRFTSAGAAVLNVPANSSQGIPIGAELTLRRAANANLTIVPASGVVVNPPAGGTLVMTQNMTATLKKVATNEWDLIGQTVAA